MNYLLIIIPFLALILLNLFPKRGRAGLALWISLMIFAAQIMVTLLFSLGVWSGVVFPQLESVLGFNLYYDKLSVFLLFTVSLVGLAALAIGQFSIKKENESFNFKNLLLVALIGMNGIAMVRDLFSLYVFIELTSVATFVLILLHQDKDALEGVLKYLVLSVVASILMLSSVALFLLAAGGTSFPALRAAVNASGGNFLILSATALFLCGLFIKGGLVPFHGWLPDVYSAAPASISVLLAGIVTKASGIFSLARFLTSAAGFSNPIKEVLLIVGTISIVVGALTALGQKDMKRMLAYSSISQMGYIVVGLGTGTRLGLLAALFHFFNHAVFKSQLFANAAAVEEQLGTRDMDKMGGLAEKMPATGITSALASLSTAGVPPLAGFWSKLLIIIALWSAGYYAYTVIAVLASVITLAYFLSLQRKVFFGKLPEELKNIHEASAGLVLPAVALASITVGVGLIFPLVVKVFMR